jgi:hypothetical protein
MENFLVSRGKVKLWTQTWETKSHAQFIMKRCKEQGIPCKIEEMQASKLVLVEEYNG